VPYYATKSPRATHVSVARLISVADDQVVRNLRPGVPLRVTPAPAVSVHWPAPVWSTVKVVPTGKATEELGGIVKVLPVATPISIILPLSAKAKV